MQLTQSSLFSQANMLNFVSNQLLLNINTMQPCKIEAVNEDNTYDVSLLVNYIDSNKKPMPTPLIYGVTRLDITAGNYGVILPPFEVGDVVLVGFCQRDITTVKQNWTKQNPSSFRKFALQDGIILAKCDNKLPTVYVKITSEGISVIAPNLPVNIQADSVNIDANTANITANTANIDATCNLGGSGGSAVLTTDTIINDSTNKPCTIVSGAATKVNAV